MSEINRRLAVPIITSLSQLIPGQAALFDDGVNPPRWVRRRLDGSLPTLAVDTAVSALASRVTTLETPLVKGRDLAGFKWFKAFRINNVANDPDSAGEGTSVLFEILGQSDFGNTANSQTSRVFASFGVRGGGIAPVLTVWGNNRLTSAASSMGFRVYKNADGYYWLYIRTATYSLSSIRYFIANYTQGVSDPFEDAGSITWDGSAWVIPTPTGSGTLIWDYDSANDFQPFVVGKGYALTSTDVAGRSVSGLNADQGLTANVAARLSIAQKVWEDPTVRIQSDHSYQALSVARGNGALGSGVFHYVLNLNVNASGAGTITVTPQRSGGAAAAFSHVINLRGATEYRTITGTIVLAPGQKLWFDVTASVGTTIQANSIAFIGRGYGQ